MSRIQSAMEYLMIYGWSVAIAVSALSALFALGLFTRTTINTSACIPLPGYVCQVPILATNGLLNISFAQSIGTISITGTGCTTSAVPPNALSSISVTDVSGAVIQLSFMCPLISNTIGSQFTGYLWFSYNTLSQSNLETEFASITTIVRRVGT